MIKRIICSVIAIFLSGKSFASDDDCGAFFIKNGVVASFPIVKKKKVWEWHKKTRSEYLWIAETGFYIDDEFKSNGFGFVAIIGVTDIDRNPAQQGTIEDLVKFSSKGAFLNHYSNYYNKEKREKIKFQTLVAAKVVDNESIVIGLVDPEAVNMAKMSNPTHIKLTATLPERDESYTCYPAIETFK